MRHGAAVEKPGHTFEPRLRLSRLGEDLRSLAKSTDVFDQRDAQGLVSGIQSDPEWARSQRCRVRLAIVLQNEGRPS